MFSSLKLKQVSNAIRPQLRYHSVARSLLPRSGLILPNSETLASRLQNSYSSISIRSLFPALVRSEVPKGFENFQDPNEKKNTEKKSSSDKEQDKNSENQGKSPFPEVSSSFLLFNLLFIAAYFYWRGSSNQEITWEEFKKGFLAEGSVERLEITDNRYVRIILKPSHRAGAKMMYFTIGGVDSFEKKLEEAQRKLGIESHKFIPLIYAQESLLTKIISSFGPTLIFVGLIALLSRRMADSLPGAGGGGGIFSVGKSRAKFVNPELVNVKFADVAGMDEAKEEIMEFVNFLKNPKMYKDLGAKIPKGALLTGPPGTGKTLLAKATAGEAGVPFLSTSGSEFQEMFVGVGPSRVRDLFKSAKESAPCIIFIDEIDAVGRARGKQTRFAGNDERENTLNQILVEMDGFDSSSEGVIVLAGTNRVDILDQALLRPGRFDRQIYISKPDLLGRVDIFKVHLKKIKTKDDISLVAEKMAALTPGFSGADIANVCNEAALIAARYNQPYVRLEDFEQAVERVVGGLEKKNKVLSIEEKTIIAHHEAGHAIAGWFLEHASPLLKVSIIPRGSNALGYAMSIPKDQYLYSKEHLLDMICVAFGGRVAEQIFFNNYSTGAQDDLKKITKIAYSQVVTYGMNEKLGNISFELPEEDSGFATRPYSDDMAQTIDNEVKKLIETAEARTKKLLLHHKDEIEKVAKVLLDKEVLKYDDMVELVGKRPFEDHTPHIQIPKEEPKQDEQSDKSK